MVFIFAELYLGYLDLVHDNKSETSLDQAKRFINWSLRDIAGEYDWEFLRGSKNLTVSANGLYSLEPITQLSASSSVYAICSDASDNGIDVFVRGRYILNNTIYSSAGVVNASAGATASAGGSTTGFSHIESISKIITTGSVFITSGSGNIIATLSPTDTYVANDINKITRIVDTAGNKNVIFRDYNTQLEANPDLSQNGTMPGYDIDYNKQLRVYNLDSTRTLNIFYTRSPKWLVYDADRTEFPYALYPEIIQFAYEVYGKRYEDEQDALPGNVMYELKKAMANNIVRKWVQGKDNKAGRVLPAWLKRVV